MAEYTQTISTSVTTNVSVGTNESVLVTQSGNVSLQSGVAINYFGGNIFFNILGVITSGDSTAVQGGGSVNIRTGVGSLISGRIGLLVEGTGPKVIENYGTISGTLRGIVSSDTGGLTILNKGTIAGGASLIDNAILCSGTSADTIINDGTIRGGAVNLGAGNDIYYGRNGIVQTIITLGDGNDGAYGGAGMETFVGDAGDDILDGGGGSDTAIFALGSTSAGAHTVDLRVSGPQDTGEGFDTLVSIENIIVLRDDYQLIGNAVANMLVTGAGSDTIRAGEGNDTLYGFTGDDLYDGGAGIDTVTFTYNFLGISQYPEDFGAVVNLNNTAAQATGYGNDIFIDIENLIGTVLADTFTGNGLANTFTGRGGDDTLDGGGGNDTLVQVVGDGNDRLFGGAGIDTVSFSGASGATINLTRTTAQSTAYGSDIYSGIENLSGGSGNDRFTGNTLANILKGNTGNDILDGGYRRDTLYGGAGKDIFVFTTKPSSSNYDKIVDYNVTYDSIQLDNKVFTKLGSGTPTSPKKLAASAFWKGAKAHDASDRIIYDSNKGYLYYDADGTGTSKQVLIATMAKGLKMTYAEFYVI